MSDQRSLARALGFSEADPVPAGHAAECHCTICQQFRRGLASGAVAQPVSAGLASASVASAGLPKLDERMIFRNQGYQGLSLEPAMRWSEDKPMPETMHDVTVYLVNGEVDRHSEIASVWTEDGFVVLAGKADRVVLRYPVHQVKLCKSVVSG